MLRHYTRRPQAETASPGVREPVLPDDAHDCGNVYSVCPVYSVYLVDRFD